MATEPPWEMNQCISLAIKITPCIVQNGWKEIDHSKLSKLKDRISDVANVDEWEVRKKITNPYEAIFSGEDSYPSLAKVQPLSRSYFKMIEMLGLIGFFNDFTGSSTCSQVTGSFVSAHICEGPGGFIQHVVEALAERQITTKGIYAMTLKPTKSHIPGWRRSIHFLKKYPKIKLEYGADDTGNILKPENQADFCRKAKGAQLFTADGGFDFSVNYTNQELMAFPLVVASFLMGLKTLEKGGTMIIKLFDIYSRATQDLFLGSGTFFEKFTLYKPATSRPCNSERYFIGHRLQPSEGMQEWITTLESALKRHEQSPITQLVQNEWPLPILRAVKEQIHYQEQLQIKNIEDTLNLDKNTIPERMLQNIRLSKKWCRTFGVKH
jgi:23S rRNA U2552 (ribose-2'-O)-methylase RlmE/FtsJ